MISLRYSGVPGYLKSSDFYLNLTPDELDSFFEVPSHCYRESDDGVNTIADLELIIRVSQFWGIMRISQSVLEFCLTHEYSTWEFVIGSAAADTKGDLEILKDTFRIPELFCLQVAIETNRDEFIEFWLSLSHNRSFCEGCDDFAIAQACRFGRLDLVQTLRERGFPWDIYAFFDAAQYGHLDVLRYLHANGCPLESNALVYAARGGWLTSMQYLRTIGCPWDKEVTLEYAVLQHFAEPYTLRYTKTWPLDGCISLPTCGYLECLRYALNNGCPIHPEACNLVCTYGLLDCLQLLHQAGADVDAHTAAVAARCSKLECLQYLRESGCPCDESTTVAAARGGHLTCLQYLHRSGCPWDATTTDSAAKEGYVDCLRYAMEEGCPHSDNVVHLAATAPTRNCLEYLISQDVFMGTDGSVLHAAFVAGRYDNFAYLWDMGCPVGSQTFHKNYIKKADKDVIMSQCIEYALEHGLMLSDSLIAFVAEWDEARKRHYHPRCTKLVKEQGFFDINGLFYYDTNDCQQTSDCFIHIQQSTKTLYPATSMSFMSSVG